ncbi:hypothetical protein Tco_0128473 [Tanacetum coccineum]
MTTLAEFMIIAGADNRPPMLEKYMYDSWKSRMELYIENRENGRMILNSVLNGPLVWPTIVEENGTTRTKKYEELSVAEKLQADCDLKATNIVLQGLAILVFTQRDDPISCLNKEMAFLTVVAASRVTVQQVQGKQGQSYVDTGYKGNATSSGGNNAGGQAREKAMLAEAQESGQILDEEQLAFLANPGIPNGQVAQTTIPNTAAFQNEDQDAYDSDCDDVSNANAILRANLSNYGSNVISEAAVQDTNLYAQQDSMILSMIEQMSEQMINHVNNWKKANQEKNNESLTAELERYIKNELKRLNRDLYVKKMIDSQMDDMIKEKLALK